jgi:hypothetical protein
MYKINTLTLNMLGLHKFESNMLELSISELVMWQAEESHANGSLLGVIHLNIIKGFDWGHVLMFLVLSPLEISLLQHSYAFSEFLEITYCPLFKVYTTEFYYMISGNRQVCAHRQMYPSLLSSLVYSSPSCIWVWVTSCGRWVVRTNRRELQSESCTATKLSLEIILWLC